MKNQLLILLMLALTSSAFAQQTPSKFELKLGLGASLLGTGDMQTILLDNELNYKLNPYFTISGGITFARSNRGAYESSSYGQGNVNLFFSPLKNTGSHDLRIGTGLSYIRVSDTWQSQFFQENGEWVEHYGFEDRAALGVNGILEYSFAITENLSLGAKTFLQVFGNQDLNTGAVLTLGIGL